MLMFFSQLEMLHLATIQYHFSQLREVEISSHRRYNYPEGKEIAYYCLATTTCLLASSSFLLLVACSRIVVGAPGTIRRSGCQETGSGHQKKSDQNIGTWFAFWCWYDKVLSNVVDIFGN